MSVHKIERVSSKDRKLVSVEVPLVSLVQLVGLVKSVN